MIHLKTLEEIELMREAALVVSKTLGMLAKEIKPGVTTLSLDKKAEEFIRDMGALPGFLGLYDCPSTILTSVNEQVVHGLPTKRPLENGDIVSVDCGSILHGFYGDHAYTFYVGEVSAEKRRLCERTRDYLYLGINEMREGGRIGDISSTIQWNAEKDGYGVVRELVGHGLGRSLHEDPQVPNFGKKGRGAKMENGLTIAIEPMINMGTHRVSQLNDGWTIVTADGKPSAHFEHDVALIDGKPEILSTFDFVEDALGIPRTTPRSRFATTE